LLTKIAQDIVYRSVDTLESWLQI